MNIKQVLATINQMQADGVIDRYAIGGAVGATFYLEPVVTLDVDIFVAFRPEPGRLLVSPQPIFDYLTARGCSVEGEYVVIADWPVQFLPPPSLLAEEALLQARAFDVGEIGTRVFSAEHLACIALELGRPKDRVRLLQFVESGVLDQGLMSDILIRHHLEDKWRRFEDQFLRGNT